MLAGPVPAIVFVRRAVFLVLVVAAGTVGLARGALRDGHVLLLGTRPARLAAFAGGAYLGSAAVYATALTGPPEQVRGLVVGAAVLSSSVLAVTVLHLDQFDLGRLAAWAWLVLFSAFTLVTFGLLVFDRSREPAVRGAMLGLAERLLLTAAGAAMATLAAALWAAPEVVSGFAPFRLPPLGGRFAGC